MEYIYAALLLHKAGKPVKEESVKAVLTAAGIAVDDARVKALVAALDGVNIEEAISKTCGCTCCGRCCTGSGTPGSTGSPGRSRQRRVKGRQERRGRERHGRAWCPVRLNSSFFSE